MRNNPDNAFPLILILNIILAAIAAKYFSDHLTQGEPGFNLIKGPNGFTMKFPENTQEPPSCLLLNKPTGAYKVSKQITRFFGRPVLWNINTVMISDDKLVTTTQCLKDRFDYVLQQRIEDQNLTDKNKEKLDKSVNTFLTELKKAFRDCKKNLTDSGIDKLFEYLQTTHVITTENPLAGKGMIRHQHLTILSPGTTNNREYVIAINIKGLSRTTSRSPEKQTAHNLLKLIIKENLGADDVLGSTRAATTPGKNFA